MVIGKIIDSSELMHWKQERKVAKCVYSSKKMEKEWYENGMEALPCGRGKGRPQKWDWQHMVSAMQKYGIEREADSPDALRSVCD